MLGLGLGLQKMYAIAKAVIAAPFNWGTTVGKNWGSASGKNWG